MNFEDYLNAADNGESLEVGKPVQKTEIQFNSFVDYLSENGITDYKATAKNHDMPKVKSDNGPFIKDKTPGLGELGDKSLKVDVKTPTGTGSAVKSSWPKEGPKQKLGGSLPAQTGKGFPQAGTVQKIKESLELTRPMNLLEFSTYISEKNKQLNECACDDMKSKEIPHITAYTAGDFHPDPIQAIKYVAHLANANDSILSLLIREMKKQESGSGMDRVVGELMNHPETFGSLTKSFGDEEKGPELSARLTRSMDTDFNDFKSKFSEFSESVAPPVGMDDEMQDMDDLEGGEHPDDEDDSDLGVAPEGEEAEDLGGETGEGEEEGEEDMEDDMPSFDGEEPKKSTKRFAHHNVIDQMHGHDHMRKYMSDKCKNGNCY